MIWSKYNFLYKSEKHDEFFLYNSRTNSFMTLTADVFQTLKNIKASINPEEVINTLDCSVKEILIKTKALTTSLEERNFILQKKLLKYKQSFQEKDLGIIILPTFGCNFKCPYCYEKDLPSEFMDEKTEDQVVRFIKRFKSSENLHLCWHGGEPLIAFNNIMSILRKIEKENTIKLKNHSMVTNGYLLNNERCHFLSKYNLNTVQVTIDGLRVQHNKSRIHKNGLPTFDIILENVERVFKIMPKCNVIIRMNVHNDNKNDFPLLHEMLTKRWGDQNYSIQMKYVNDHKNGCKVDCLKNRNKIFYAQNLYIKHNFKNIDFYPTPKIGGCAATQLNSFVIGVKGELYKCWVDVGKKDKVIGDIYSNNYNMNLISEYILGTDMFNDKKCLDCLLLPICDGGCNLRRLEYKISNKPYDLCPIDTANMDTLLDMFYEKEIKN